MSCSTIPGFSSLIFFSGKLNPLTAGMSDRMDGWMWLLGGKRISLRAKPKCSVINGTKACHISTGTYCTINSSWCPPTHEVKAYIRRSRSLVIRFKNCYYSCKKRNPLLLFTPLWMVAGNPCCGQMGVAGKKTWRANMCRFVLAWAHVCLLFQQQRNVAVEFARDTINSDSSGVCRAKSRKKVRR